MAVTHKGDFFATSGVVAPVGNTKKSLKNQKFSHPGEGDTIPLRAEILPPALPLGKPSDYAPVCNITFLNQ